MERRVTIFLSLLGSEVADSLLASLPTQRQQGLRERMRQLRDSPPTRSEVRQVLGEFDRMIRLVTHRRDGDRLPAAASPPAATARPSRARPHHARSDARPTGTATAPAAGPLPDDPFVAITLISDLRLSAALRGETPRTVALVLKCLPEEQAGRILQMLAPDLRDAVVLQIKEKLTPPRALLRRLIEAALHKCLSFVDEELQDEQEDSESRVARLLRTMSPQRRGEVLEMLEQADSESCGRIRDALFSFEDLLRVEERTLQRILGEIDGGTLAVALSTADARVTELILGNLSRRAREGLQEEISLMGKLPPAQIVEAQKNVVRVMIELDKTGELTMKT